MFHWDQIVMLSGFYHAWVGRDFMSRTMTFSLQLHSQRYMLWTIKFKVSGLDETEQQGVP